MKRRKPRRVVHRQVPSTGACWTMREVEPGIYAYDYATEPCGSPDGAVGRDTDNQRSTTP